MTIGYYSLREIVTVILSIQRTPKGFFIRELASLDGITCTSLSLACAMRVVCARFAAGEKFRLGCLIGPKSRTIHDGPWSA